METHPLARWRKDHKKTLNDLAASAAAPSRICRRSKAARPTRR